MSPDSLIHFVFLSTRKRLRLRVAPLLIESLEWFDGSTSVADLEARFLLNAAAVGSGSIGSFREFVGYLYEHGVLVRKDWMNEIIPPQYAPRFSRQLNLLLDIEESTKAASELFDKIRGTKIALIGVGAVGSWILKELLQIGFERFVLVDPALLAPSDRARNALFNQQSIGEFKVAVAERHIHRQAINPEVQIQQKALDLYTDVSSLIGSDVDLIVNTADEPYIGATSIKLSRYCVRKDLPLLVAGGFDAHLGSLSEMIVPGRTPCSDCYALHFEKELRDWNPISHPVIDRKRGFGGLPTLSTFAASAAVLKILRLFSKKGGDIEQGRGEFLFDHYNIDRFKVERNRKCPTCGDAKMLQAHAD